MHEKAFKGVFEGISSHSENSINYPHETWEISVSVIPVPICYSKTLTHQKVLYKHPKINPYESSGVIHELSLLITFKQPNFHFCLSYPFKLQNGHKNHQSKSFEVMIWVRNSQKCEVCFFFFYKAFTDHTYHPVSY